MRYLWVLVFCFYISDMCGQEWDFSYTAGFTTPLGAFADDQTDGDEHAMATNGFFTQITGDYIPSKFGVGFSLLYSSNDIDNRSTALHLEQIIEQQVLQRPLTETDRLNLNYVTDKWRWSSLLVGPVYKFSVNDFSVILRAMTGLQLNYVSEANLSYSNIPFEVITSAVREKGRDVSLPLLAGVQFAVDVFKNISLHFSIDYYQGNIVFDEVVTRRNREMGVFSRTEISSKKIRAQNINAGVGLIYRLEL